jgi:hypothetical protein
LAEGSLPLRNEDRLVPDPLIVGRDRLDARTAAQGGLRWTGDVASALALG